MPEGRLRLPASFTKIRTKTRQCANRRRFLSRCSQLRPFRSPPGARIVIRHRSATVSTIRGSSLRMMPATTLRTQEAPSFLAPITTSTAVRAAAIMATRWLVDRGGLRWARASCPAIPEQSSTAGSMGSRAAKALARDRPQRPVLTFQQIDRLISIGHTEIRRESRMLALDGAIHLPRDAAIGEMALWS